MEGFVVVCGVILVAATLCSIYRLAKGPTLLDRVVATDVLVSVVIAGLALEAVLNRHTTTLPVMLVLSLLGFTGSVSIARFVADRDKATRWEVADPERATRPPEGRQ